MPGPRSSTSTTTAAHHDSTGVSAGLNFNVLSRRLATARSSSVTRPVIEAASTSSEISRPLRRRWRSRPVRRARRGRPAARPPRSWVSVASSTSSLTRSVSSRSSTSVALSNSSRCSSLKDARPLQQLDVGAQRGERCAELVARVHHQPALLLARSAQRVEHAVEARRQPAHLVVAVDGDRVGRGPGSRRRRSRYRSAASIGRTVRRAISHASEAAISVPNSAMSNRRASSVESTLLLPSMPRAICTAPPVGSATVSIRYGSSPTVMSRKRRMAAALARGGDPSRRSGGSAVRRCR